MVGSVTTKELLTKPTAKLSLPQLTEFLQPWELVQSDFYPESCLLTCKFQVVWVPNVKIHDPNVIVRLCSLMIVGGLVDKRPLCR